MDELNARNAELEKRISDLERKISMLENASNRQPNSSKAASSPLVSSTPDSSIPGAAPKAGSSIPATPKLEVVKMHPPAPLTPAPLPASGTAAPPRPGKEEPSLFGDDPSFEETSGPEDPVGTSSSGSGSQNYSDDPDPSGKFSPSGGEGLPVEGATLFESAMGQFYRGEYELASEAFLLYITRYPNTVYESGALFYLGQCKFNMKNFSDAVEQFRRYLMKYPNGKEASMALLQLGISFERMQDLENAKKAFKQVIDRFPNSAAAEAAKREMENML